MELGSTLREAVIYFQNYDNCHKFMVELRWPNGVVRCPRCSSEHVVYLQKARVWKCYSKHESPKFSLKTGTVFEDSPLGLDKWLPAVWMIVNDKNGTSSWELHRAIGVTRKTAWFMLHRIRLAMQDDGGSKLSGEVEHLAQFEHEHLLIRQGRQLIVSVDKIEDLISVPPSREAKLRLRPLSEKGALSVIEQSQEEAG
jgi:transposase-like protein